MASTNFGWIRAIHPSNRSGMPVGVHKYRDRLGWAWRQSASKPTGAAHIVAGRFDGGKPTKRTESARVRQAARTAKANGLVWDAERNAFVPMGAPRLGGVDRRANG